EERRQRKQAEEELKILNESLEQRVAEQTAELAKSEEIFRSISSSAQDAIIMADNEGRISYWNEAAENMFGYSKEDAARKKLHELIIPERLREHFLKGFKLFRETGKGPVIGKVVEFSAVRKDGTEFPVEHSISAVKIRDKWATVGIIRDITERKQAEETITHMAYHDNLTALPNRMLFVDHLNLELAHARRNRAALAVMFLDLDEFKDINDTLGHTLGDRLLKEVAARLIKIMRESDTVARLGGDEFTLLLPGNNDVASATQVADKILEEVRQPMTLDKNNLSITTSIGIAIYPGDGKDADTLLKNADAAMYHAKERGRNNFQFYNNLS
ncbi:MAG: diguanylate cyclase, partial [Candidatus Brocadiales bacterium]|nr:diguanylate cyclase [Candidatus Bathyanammoxibius sp.]